MENRDGSKQFKDVAKGLNSPELRSNTNIPFADEFVELDNVRVDEPMRPKRLRDPEKGEELNIREGKREDRKLHASDLGAVRTPNSDTIVVDTPEGTLYITLDPETSKSKPTSPSTLSTDVTISPSSPSTSRAFGAQDANDLIAVEKDVEHRRASLRRNSISMPTLQNMELLRQEYLRNTQDGVRCFSFFSIKYI
ncbi:jg8309 [Pararge aegeria aegeria]|uniref:Jg8309 protein n=1 Tax=Pararge aegeria aegeria TaxID=348720 RepID=A0A8S4SJW4_9NEOP|nr:jg8309 [Pararge aegeria aegeria]